jgi:tRNA (guanine-N7-)-methyltransferase
MRQRKIKNVGEKIILFDGPLVSDPASKRGKWRTVFYETPEAESGGNDPRGGFDIYAGGGESAPEDTGESSRARLYLEIGIGKGRFITESALRDPNALFLGFEGQESVLYRALQRAYIGPDVPTRELNEIAVSFLGIIDSERDEKNAPAPPPNLRYCAEYIFDMSDFFADGELDGIFLNFCDPWPKARQEKRRLTSPKYLDGYARALISGGFIRFKTDNDKLFAYSKAQFESLTCFEITAETHDLHNSKWGEKSIRTDYELRFLNLNKKIHYLEARCSHAVNPENALPYR